jgi:DNA gyrase/topoisomerase IV subunit A
VCWTTGFLFLGGKLITPRKIDEWIREVAERPVSAPEIIRLIANRMGELERWNEELRDENIQLRLGKRVEEYQRRIENLEYQLDLLRRQLSPEVVAEKSTTNLILYNSLGKILRVEVDFQATGSEPLMSRFQERISNQEITPSLLIVEEQEEALFLFDSGRISTMAVTDIPKLDPDNLDWERAYLKEPGIGEELVAVLPSARMSLYEFCIQTSRRGYVRKIQETFFENHLSRGFVGSGVSLESDKPCSLAFADREDLLVMVSREGMVFSMDVAGLPVTVEEAVRLAPTDFIVASFIARGDTSLVFVTQNGKVIHREMGWLEPANALKTKGQAVISKERRAAGVRIVGAAAGGEEDWEVTLLSDGRIYSLMLRELFSKGSIFTEDETAEVVGFAVYQIKSDE